MSIDPQHLSYYVFQNIGRPKKKVDPMLFQMTVISDLAILFGGGGFWHGVILLVLSFRLTDLPLYLCTTPMCPDTPTHAHAQYKQSTPVLAPFELASPKSF